MKNGILIRMNMSIVWINSPSEAVITLVSTKGTLFLMWLTKSCENFIINYSQKYCISKKKKKKKKIKIFFYVKKKIIFKFFYKF